MSRELLRFHRDASADDAFCPGAEPCSSKGYPHADIVEQGGLDRALLTGGDFTSHEGWSIDHPEKSGAIITGVRAGKAPDVTASTRRRQLKAHGDGVELIVVLRGIAWVAVTSEKQGHGEMQRAYEFSHDIDDPDWLPANVTGLVATGESGMISCFSTQLLSHGLDSAGIRRPLRACFLPRPRAIRLKSVAGHDVAVHPPVEVPKRASGGSGQLRSMLAHVPETRRWVRASAVRSDAANQVVVTGPWEAEAKAQDGPMSGCAGPKAASRC